MPNAESRQRGFTLIELLIVVAIIGIIAAILIPNLIDAMNKAKQKRTIADIHMTGTAMMSWLTDQASAAAAGAAATQVDLNDYRSISYADISVALSPLYINQVGPRDGWKTSFDYYLNIEAPFSEHVMGVRSNGRDKVDSGDVYTASPFDATDYDQDILWADGFFVRWPEGLN